MEYLCTAEAVCRPSEDIVAREIEGELVIVPLTAGIGDAEDELYTVTPTGKAVWERLNGTATLGEIAAALADRFEAPREEIERDILGFVGELLKRKIAVSVGDRLVGEHEPASI